MRRFLILPIGIAVTGIIYFWLSHEPAGGVLLIVFSLAMALFGWSLVPTFDNAGPTAPVDPDYEL